MLEYAYYENLSFSDKTLYHTLHNDLYHTILNQKNLMFTVHSLFGNLLLENFQSVNYICFEIISYLLHLILISIFNPIQV